MGETGNKATHAYHLSYTYHNVIKWLVDTPVVTHNPGLTSFYGEWRPGLTMTISLLFFVVRFMKSEVISITKNQLSDQNNQKSETFIDKQQ